MRTSYKVFIGVLIFIILVLLARYIVFTEKFDEWGAGLERISEWETDYKRSNPNATDAEVKAAFESAIANITVWKEKYKQENPGATDEDADAAFNKAWGK